MKQKFILIIIVSMIKVSNIIISSIMVSIKDIKDSMIIKVIKFTIFVMFKES